MAAREDGAPKVASTNGTAIANVLRIWVDVYESPEPVPMRQAIDPEPISPELVLVDPELRRRIAELPTGPTLPPVLRIVQVKPAPQPVERSSGLGLVASIAYALVLILILPVLAIAADLVRSGAPRLAPPATPRSGRVHVPLQKHVVPEPPSTQTPQSSRPR